MRKLLMILSMVLLGIGLVTAQEQTADPLWEKAVALAGLNQDLVPGIMVTRTAELGDDGKQKSVEESWMRFYPDQNNNIAVELLKVVKDGQDITAERKRKFDEARQKPKRQKDPQNKNKEMNFGDSNPFVPELQTAVTKKYLERLELIQGKNCRVYEVSLTKDRIIYKGLTWLEENTGIPLKLQYTPEPLPKFTTRLFTVVNYTYDNNGPWYPATMIIEASGKFLLIKKNIRMVLEFSEYWKHSSPSQI